MVIVFGIVTLISDYTIQLTVSYFNTTDCRGSINSQACVIGSKVNKVTPAVAEAGEANGITSRV